MQVKILPNKELLGLWLSRYHMASVAVGDTIKLFTSINSELDTLELLSNSMGLDIKGLDAIVCLISSLGILSRDKNKISLNEVSATYLLPSSEFYWGEVLTYTRNTLEYHVILDSLLGRKISNKSTQLTIQGQSFAKAWEQGGVSLEETQQFMNIMHSTIFAPAKYAVESGVFSRTAHLLDVGGGSGCFSRLFLNKYPNKKVTIFELPQTCNILQAKLSDLIYLNQLRLSPGNFFIDDLPKGADGILFSNVLHDWPVDCIKTLLGKAFKTLPSGGKIYVHEMLLNENKDGPLTAATFNLFMFSNYQAQQLSLSELEILLAETGFINCMKHQTHSDFSVTIAVKP